MDWHEQAVELLNQELDLETELTVADLEDIELPNFSAYITVGAALEDGDVLELMDAILGDDSPGKHNQDTLESAFLSRIQGDNFEDNHNKGNIPDEDDEEPLDEDDEYLDDDEDYVEEADNPYASSPTRQSQGSQPNNNNQQQQGMNQQGQDAQQNQNDQQEPEVQASDDDFLGEPRKLRVGDEVGEFGKVARIVSDTEGKYEVVDQNNKRHVVQVAMNETTTAGGIAVSPVAVGGMIRRQPAEKPRPKKRGNVSTRRRKK